MTVRAVFTSLLLGLFVSVATYFNDFVIRQTMLIGNHLPISVFGVAMLVLLGLNPLLGSVSRRLPLKPAELAVMVAVALAACGWPGSGFYRGLATTTALPAHWQQTESGWQAAEVISYVPGGAAHIAPRQVRDSSVLAGKLHTAEPGSDAARVVERFSDLSRRAVAEVAGRERATQKGQAMKPEVINCFSGNRVANVSSLVPNDQRKRLAFRHVYMMCSSIDYP